MELANRDALEAKFAGRLGSLAARHRSQLRTLLGNPPDVRRVPETFWLRVQREQEDEMTALLLLIFLASGDEHATAAGVNVTRELVVQAEGAGVDFARKRASLVSTGFVQHSRDMLQTAGERWARSGGDIPATDIDGTLDSLFGDRRIGGVAANETTQAQYSGADYIIRDTVGVSELDTWFTRTDGLVCEICAPLHREPRSVWETRFPQGPPAHPWCRCWIEYGFEK